MVMLIIIAFNNLHRLTRSHSLPQVPIGEGGSVSRVGKGGRVAKAGVAKTSIAKTKTIAVASSQVGGVSLSGDSSNNGSNNSLKHEKLYGYILGAYKNKMHCFF